MKTAWKNVAGRVVREEIMFDERGNLFDVGIKRRRKLPEWCATLIDRDLWSDGGSLVIAFESSGDIDHGDWDNPPYRDEERVVTGAKLVSFGGEETVLPGKLADVIGDLYSEEIYACELDVGAAA